MSRPAQLPPRFPNHSKGQHQHPAAQVLSSVRYLGDDQTLRPPHSLHRFPSQDFFDDQTLWLDSLLDDTGGSSSSTTGSRSGATTLRRAVSDPVRMLEESLAFDFSSFCSSPLYGTNDDAGAVHGSGGASADERSRSNDGGDDLIDKITACNGMDSGSLYGPNSPRKMNSLTKSETSVVSAAFEGVNWGNPFRYISAPSDANSSSNSTANKPEAKADAGVMPAAANVVDQNRAAKRHTGQRSRVRKLQYIAELERTVNLYQAMEADLAAKVASLFHQRAILSLENSNLKQQLAGLKKEKMMKDGEHQFLKKELKKFKTAYGHHASHRKSMSSSCYPMGGMGPIAAADSSEINWGTLDMAMGNLTLKETPPMKYGFRNSD